MEQELRSDVEQTCSKNNSAVTSVPLRGILSNKSSLRVLGSEVAAHQEVTLGRDTAIASTSYPTNGGGQVNLVMSCGSAFERTDSIRYPKPSIAQKLLELLKYILKKEKAIES